MVLPMGRLNLGHLYRLNQRSTAMFQELFSSNWVGESNVNLPRTRRTSFIAPFCALRHAQRNTPASRYEATAACELDRVQGHVREQFAQFGPLSTDRQYFGFIYSFRPLDCLAR